MNEPRDLIIVGAGAAGMTAAIDAAELGLRPTVLESFPHPGGAAATSGGGCCIAGSPLQASLGIEDSPELALSDWTSWSQGTIDQEWARFYLERSCTDLFHWLQELGVEWIGVREQEGNSVPRWHAPKGEGRSLMEVLYQAAKRLPIEFRFSTRVSGLVQDDEGGVIGVRIDGEKGSETLFAHAVLIATGGFTNNHDMISEFIPDPGPGSRLLCGGARQAVGDGRRMLEDVGAHFTFLERIWMYPYGTPDPLDEAGRRGFAVRNMTDEIWVNANGQRFHDESRRGGKTGLKALMAQTPRTCWSIFDRDQAERLTLADPYYRDSNGPLRDRIETFLTESPFVHHADSIEELAENVGFPKEVLVETVARWNEHLQGAADGSHAVDPDFGRPLKGLKPIQKAPFYALQYFPLARKNFGGVRTDIECRVLRPDGSAIPGLYAAGEVAGMAGGFINGQAGLEGTMLGPSLFSGRVAGRSIAGHLRSTEQEATS